MPEATLADDTLLQAFEARRLDPGGFRHRDHVRLAWLLLGREPEAPHRALGRFAEGLKGFAAAIGKASLYHETITWAYLLLIRERMARTGPHADFDAFARDNPDLLRWRPGVLDALYRPETLASPLARQVFVLPDAARRS